MATVTRRTQHGKSSIRITWSPSVLTLTSPLSTALIARFLREEEETSVRLHRSNSERNIAQYVAVPQSFTVIRLDGQLGSSLALAGRLIRHNTEDAKTRKPAHCLAPLGLALIDHIMENRRVKYPCDPRDVITATAEPPERERGEKIVVGVNLAERESERKRERERERERVYYIHLFT